MKNFQLMNEIKSLASQIEAKQKSLMDILVELNEEVVDSLGSLQIYAESKKITLEMIGPDDWNYGNLFLHKEGLALKYRSTQEDYEDQMNHVPSEYQNYHIREIKELNNIELKAVTDKNVIKTLLNSIRNKLSYNLEESTISISELENLLNSQTELIDQQVIESIQEYTKLYKDWLKARNLVASDPSDSITRSSSYLESVCKIIIEEKNGDFPTKSTISNLLGSALSIIEINEPKETIDDINKIVGGIKSIISGIGAARTHVGTAHGSFQDDVNPSKDLALLINNCAASISSFLINKM